MAIFISYSRQDSAFVDRLALALIKARVHVWIDRWELKAGDSIVQQIQGAIESAGALLVVLSKASVVSEWCRKELSVGLIRELEERQVVVVPALIEDCEIPLFLRDKLYADFRTDFRQGLKQVLNALAKVVSVERGRDRADDATTDWALDWGVLDDRPMLQVTFVQQRRDAAHSVLTTVQAFPNSVAEKRNLEYAEVGLRWLANLIAVEFVAGGARDADARVLVTDKMPAARDFVVHDKATGVRYTCRATCRLLGEDPGNDILVDVTGLLTTSVRHIAGIGRPLTDEEKVHVARIQAKRAGT